MTRAQMAAGSFNKQEIQNFPDGPVVKTQHIHCRGMSLISGQGSSAKKKKKQRNSEDIKVRGEGSDRFHFSLSLCLWNIQSLGKKSTQ